MKTHEKLLMLLGGGTVLLVAGWLLFSEGSFLDPATDPAGTPVGSRTAKSERELPSLGDMGESGTDRPAPKVRPLPPPDARSEGPESLRGSVIGRVYLGTEPLEGATIRVAPGPRDYIGETPAVALTPRQGSSDQTGFFLVDDVPGGSGYVVTVRHPDTVAVQVRSIRVSPYEATDIGQIVLDAGSRIQGRVVGPEDEPVENASIVFEAAAKRPGPFSGREQDPGTDQRTSTDADGVFLLDHVGSANYVVRVDAAGYAPVHRNNFRVDRKNAGEELLIRLQRPAVIAGRVTDPDGNPIAGANLFAQTHSPTDDGSRCEAETTTDADGRFRYDRLAQGKYWILAKAAGYQDINAHSLDVGKEDVEIVMQPSAMVRGRVVHPDGRPATQFTLRLESLLPDPESPGAQQRYMASGNPDDTQHFESPDGSFEYTFGRSRSGSFRLVSWGPDHADSPSRSFDIRGSEVIEGVKITAESGGRLEGHVRNSSGDPIHGALIRLRDKNANEKGIGELFESAFMTPDRTRTVEVRSDANGFYELPYLLPAEYKIQIIHPSYSEHWLRNVVVRDRQVTKQDIGMIAGGRVIGVATDAQTGEVLSNGIVVVTSLSGTNQVRVLTDAQGRFEVRNLPAGSYRLSRGPAADPFNILANPNQITFEVAPGTEIDLGQL